MKVAIPAKGKELDSRVSEAFGRCEFFSIVQLEDGKVTGHEALANEARMQSRGAGITAVDLVAEQGVDVVVSEFLGPKAFAVLNEVNIKAYKGFPGTVRENAEKLAKGGLEEFQSAAPGRGRGLVR